MGGTYTNSKHFWMKRKKIEKKFSYPVYSARVEEDIKTWLLRKQKNFRSQNKFFKELKRRYVERHTETKKRG